MEGDLLLLLVTRQLIPILNKLEVSLEIQLLETGCQKTLIQLLEELTIKLKFIFWRSLKLNIKSFKSIKTLVN